MPKKKILYISGSLGLGHITRDLAIAKELRRQDPDIELSWLASYPASLVVKNVGETLLPESDSYIYDINDIIPVENVAGSGKLNQVKYAQKAKKAWAHNVEVFKHVMSKEQFDLVIGDETYEIYIALGKRYVSIEPTFIMIFDFIGLESMTRNPLERLGVFLWNRTWVNSYKNIPDSLMTVFFVGEEEDIPDKRFDFFLPNRRIWARDRCKFLGYILTFDPADCKDRAKIRAKLGYGKDPLVVCSIGGTSVGKILLELCGEAYSIIKKVIPDLRMVLVCGPRLPVDSLKVQQGIELRGYVPALYEHLAACDLAIVLGGATTTLELTALNRPFLYFPLEEHCEQQNHVAARLARHQAGVKMSFRYTFPKSLAEAVIANIGKEVDYPNIPLDGAQKAAQLIQQLL